MTSGFSFIQNSNAEYSGERLITLGETPAHYPALAEQATVTPLGDRGVLSVSGPDMVKLLQGQLTCDMSQLAATGSLKGALCDSKGRMISSFVCVQQAADQVLLVMHRELVAATLDTLKKYAVFYKAVLTDSSDQYFVFGTHNSSQPLAGAFIGQITPALQLVVCPSADAPQYWQQLSAVCQPTGDAFWNHLLISAGEGEVKPQTQGEFIPQMLNFQLIDAVNFRKGCYTGQEIVARMQYLGKLKRRMYHLRIATDLDFNPGEVVGAGGRSGLGTVVMATERGTSKDLLAVLTEDAAKSESLDIGGYSGAFAAIPLPYDSGFPETAK